MKGKAINNHSGSTASWESSLEAMTSMWGSGSYLSYTLEPPVESFKDTDAWVAQPGIRSPWSGCSLGDGFCWSGLLYKQPGPSWDSTWDSGWIWLCTSGVSLNTFEISLSLGFFFSKEEMMTWRPQVCCEGQMLLKAGCETIWQLYINRNKIWYFLPSWWSALWTPIHSLPTSRCVLSLTVILVTCPQKAFPSRGAYTLAKPNDILLPASAATASHLKVTSSVLYLLPAHPSIPQCPPFL